LNGLKDYSIYFLIEISFCNTKKDHNKITGSIPTSLSVLNQLEVLSLRKCQGNIVSFLHQILTKHLYAYKIEDENKISGSLPSELASLQKLKEINFCK